MLPKPISRAALALTALASATHARAQQANPQGWQFSVTPYLWLSGVSGTLETPHPSVPSVNASASFGSILSKLDSIPIMGSAEVRNGPFGVVADIIALSVKTGIDTRGLLFSGGSAKLSAVIGDAVFAYRVLADPQQSVDLGIGVRAFGISTDFTVGSALLPGFSRSPGASWADPILAVRYHIDLGPKWGLTAYGDIGGGASSSFTWQVLGTVDYRVTNAIILRAGYRHLNFQYSAPRLDANLTLSGPIIGATFRF